AAAAARSPVHVFFQAEDGIRDFHVTGVQTCALPIWMLGFTPPVAYDGSVASAPETITLGDYRFEVAYIDPWTPEEDQAISAHGGLVIQAGPEKYYFAGSGLTITASPANSADGKAGIESAREGRMEKGKWTRGRLMDGEQTHQGRHVRLEPDRFSIQKVTYYRYD